MGPKGSVLHSQGLSDNPYPELNQSSLIPISYVVLIDSVNYARTCSTYHIIGWEFGDI